MNDYLSTITAIILCVLLLFVFPVYETYQMLDRTSDNIVRDAAEEFVSTVCQKGYVSPAVYNDFMQKILATRNNYEVELVHRKYSPVPDYDDPANAATFKGTFSVGYLNHYTGEIMKVMLPNTAAPIGDVSREYKMSTGDYFEVTITSTNRTQAQLLNGQTGARIYYHRGGLVRNSG